MKIRREEDGRFGFTWGENDQFTFLRHPDGGVKRVDAGLVDALRDVATSDGDLDDLRPETREALAEFEREGFLYDGPIYELTPPKVAVRARLAVTVLLLALVGGVGLLAGIDFYTEALAEDAGGLWYVGVAYAVSVVVFLIHELGHVYATARFAPVELRLGTVNAIVPAVKTDTTETWMFDRMHRLWVNVAGPTVQALVVAPFALAALVIDVGHLGDFLLFGYGLGAVIVLNPLIHGDGYLAMMELLDVQNVKKRGIEAFRRRELNALSAYVVASYGFAGVVVGWQFFTLLVLSNSVLEAGAIAVAVAVLSYIDIGDGSGVTLASRTTDWAEEISENADESSLFA